ncbi:MAG: family 1 encapsulin nanocompartment shell protein, partial [Chloroflexota bacterium]
LLVSEILPIPLIHKTFTLSKRDLAAFEREKIPLYLRPLVETTIEVARIEDDLIFNGAPGVAGLLSVPGTNRVKLSSWDTIGTAANDVIQAITTLDSAGFHGPYSLALAADRYNLLLRMYQQGNRTELDHIKEMVTDGVVKAASLKSGGILVASGRPYASILLGQDMRVGFIGPVEEKLEFSISESLTVYVRQPSSVCVLQ